jgi:hypothetical protein
MIDGWRCQSCNSINNNDKDICGICDKPRKNENMKCPKCGTSLHPALNYCPKCKKAIRPSRLKDRKDNPSVDKPITINCFIARQDETIVFSSPNPDSEILYLMGPNESLPVNSELGIFYCLILPGNELGFVFKKAGIIVRFGIGEVEKPLGYVRNNFAVDKTGIYVLQPDNRAISIGVLNSDDHFPIVEESEEYFKIQLPSGLQGWVQKASVVRTLSPKSVLFTPPETSSSDLGSNILSIAGIVALGMIGGLVGASSEEDRIRRGVGKALQDRGL